MRELIKALIRLWARLFGGATPSAGTAPPAALVEFLAAARTEVTTAIEDETTRHIAALTADGLITAPITNAAQQRATTAKDLASAMLEPARVMADGQTPALAAFAQPAKLELANQRAERDAYTEAETRAARDKATGLGEDWGLMWVAHRDCCVNCLAYSGLVIKSEDMFDGGLSFRAANKDRFADAIPGPPLHPNDRCHLEVVHLETSGAASDALKREALRAGVLGWSLRSESDKARREAAQELLHRQLRLPKSVLDKARRKLGVDGPFRSPVPPVR